MSSKSGTAANKGSKNRTGNKYWTLTCHKKIRANHDPVCKCSPKQFQNHIKYLIIHVYERKGMDVCRDVFLKRALLSSVARSSNFPKELLNFQFKGLYIWVICYWFYLLEYPSDVPWYSFSAFEINLHTHGIFLSLYCYISTCCGTSPCYQLRHCTYTRSLEFLFSLEVKPKKTPSACHVKNAPLQTANAGDSFRKQEINKYIHT